MARRRTSKRGKGEGSVFELPNKTWRGKVTVGYNADGRQKFRWVSGKTQGEALAKVSELKARLASGTYTDTKLTVGDYLKLWLEQKSHEVKPRSHEFYETYCRLYISPTLGGMRLDKVTTPDIRCLLMDVKNKVSPDCANKVRMVFFGAMKQAMKDGLIARNPVEPISLFKVDRKPNDHAWEPTETLRFIETARTHRLFAAFYLALATGLRHGEVLGLRWKDLEGDTLHVRQSLIVVRHAYHLSTPKTQRGVRRLMLDGETLAVLETRRLLQHEEKHKAGDSWGPSSSEFEDLIFTTETGGPIHPRNFDRTWYALLEAAKVTKVRFHDMRHMHVSLLHKAGVELRAISDRIGHTDPSFTMKRYAHVIDDQRRAAAIPLLKLLSPRQSRLN